MSQGSLPLICGPACLHVLDSKSPEGCHEVKTHKHTMRLNAHFVKAVLASAAKNMGCVSTRAAYTYIILACVSCTAVVCGKSLLRGGVVGCCEICSADMHLAPLAWTIIVLGVTTQCGHKIKQAGWKLYLSENRCCTHAHIADDARLPSLPPLKKFCKG